MPVIVTDASQGPNQVRVTNTDTGTSQTAEKSAQAIADAVKAQSCAPPERSS